MEIKQGFQYECIKSVVMKTSDNTIAFTKGHTYVSHRDGCLTDNMKNDLHGICDNGDSSELFVVNDHFKLMLSSDHHKNMLIAYLNGWKPLPLGKKYTPLRLVELRKGKRVRALRNFKYDTSWGWLMPIVKVCMRMANDEHLTSWVNGFKVALATCDREAVYNEVVGFLEDCHKYERDMSENYIYKLKDD